MDENYLDNLLNEFSLDKEIDHKIEDELDGEIAKEKQRRKNQNQKSQEDLFNMDLDLDSDIEAQDTFFSESQMDELDALDEFADLDMGDMDFSDIDFDDLDMTKLDDLDSADLDDMLKEFDEDFVVQDGFDLGDDESANDALPEDLSEADSSSTGDTKEEATENVVAQSENLNEDSFDADEFLDSLIEEDDQSISDKDGFEELPEDNASESNNVSVVSDEEDGGASSDSLEDLLNDVGESEYDAMGAMDGFSDFGQIEELPEEPSTSSADGELEELSNQDNEALDDLFSLLDLEEGQEDGGSQVETVSDEGLASNLDLTDLGDLEDIEDLDQPNQASKPEKSKKKSIMELLFGSDDDDDDELSEEELAKLAEEKAAKKAAKAAKKAAAAEAKAAKAEAGKSKKDAANAKKKQADAAKKKVKAEKKAKKKAAAAAEAANAEPEKKLNKPMVIFVFTFLFGGVGVIYLGMNNFNYTQAIEKATNYFESQKYHKAYDEIKGVDVKKKDQDLKDRIYTVMYVERLYESYENNIQLGFNEKALDSLLRGVEKYEEHYEEAQELGIVADIDSSYAKIQEALSSGYGISVDEAKAINMMDDVEYVTTIREKIQNVSKPLDGQANETPSENTEEPSVNKEDANVPENQEQEEEVAQ